MTVSDPIYAGEGKAARLLDLTVAEFRKLVRAGHLPRGREIAPGYVRWFVDDLKNIGGGNAADGMGDVKW